MSAAPRVDQDHYAVLGVARTATPEEIRRAYRKLARTLHPDANKNQDSDAEERFKSITWAYDVLSDPDKRLNYDRDRRDAEAGVPKHSSTSATNATIEPPRLRLSSNTVDFGPVVIGDSVKKRRVYLYNDAGEFDHIETKPGSGGFWSVAGQSTDNEEACAEIIVTLLQDDYTEAGSYEDECEIRLCQEKTASAQTLTIKVSFVAPKASSSRSGFLKDPPTSSSGGSSSVSTATYITRTTPTGPVYRPYRRRRKGLVGTIVILSMLLAFWVYGYNANKSNELAQSNTPAVPALPFAIPPALTLDCADGKASNCITLEIPELTGAQYAQLVNAGYSTTLNLKEANGTSTSTIGVPNTSGPHPTISTLDEADSSPYSAYTLTWVVDYPTPIATTVVFSVSWTNNPASSNAAQTQAPSIQAPTKAQIVAADKVTISHEIATLSLKCLDTALCPLFPAGYDSYIPVFVSGLDANFLHTLETWGYHDRWTDNHGTRVSSFPASDAGQFVTSTTGDSSIATGLLYSQGAYAGIPAGSFDSHGLLHEWTGGSPWTIRWSLIDPSGRVVRTLQYTARTFQFNSSVDCFASPPPNVRECRVRALAGGPGFAQGLKAYKVPTAKPYIPKP